MEAWKDELYHYGIKGMKWGKRKRMSDLERAGRNFEVNKRREDALYDATMDELKKKKRDNSKLDRLQAATVKAMDNTYYASKNLRERSTKILKKIKKDDPQKRLRKTLRGQYTPNLLEATGTIHNLTGTDEAKAKAKKRVQRKVKRADTKYKVKAFTRKIFKKR